MGISTYAELKVSIQNWSKRSGTDVLNVLDDFIDLAEADIANRLRIRDMEARATATSSTSSRYLELPDGYLSMRRLSMTSGSNRFELQSTTPESMKVLSSSGWPRFFAVTSQIEFDRTPDSAYTVEMQYYRSVNALSSTNTTNAILTRFPMVYLYGCLMHFANWALNDAMFEKYALMFQGAIDSANSNDIAGRYGPAPAVRAYRTTP